MTLSDEHEVELLTYVTVNLGRIPRIKLTDLDLSIKINKLLLLQDSVTSMKVQINEMHSNSESKFIGLVTRLNSKLELISITPGESCSTPKQNLQQLILQIKSNSAAFNGRSGEPVKTNADTTKASVIRKDEPWT